MKSFPIVKILNTLRQNLKIMAFFLGISFLIGIIYVTVFYQTTYSSTSKLLVEENQQSSQDLTQENNGNKSQLMQTQLNIINSDDIASKVWQKIGYKFKIKNNLQAGTKLIQNAVEIKNPQNTNIIEITAHWNNPKIAVEIVTEYLTSYYNFNLSHSKVLISQTQKLIDEKLKIAKDNLSLAKLNNQLARENNWANIITTLNKEQSNLLIQELSSVESPKVLVYPTKATLSTFPDKLTYIELFMLIGLITGIISILILNRYKFNDIDEIGQELNAPILGSVPWLDDTAYNNSDTLFVNDEVPSFYSVAYQKIISNLTNRSYSLGAKSFVFTSSELSKSRSTLLMNIAHGLSKTGQSVILIDADFRTPSIHKEFGLLDNNQYSLAGLLSNITADISDSGEFNWKLLNYFLAPVNETENFHIIVNNGNIPDPNEFLYSKAFKILIQKLKEQYDWILIDTPPILAVPDAASVAIHTDGTIIVTGIDANKNQIRKIKNQFKTYNSQIFGVITREIHNYEAVSKNQYIKQIIYEMMNQKSDNKNISC